MDYLQKLVLALALPPGGPLLLGVLGALLAWQGRRSGRALLVLALASLWLLATPEVSDALRYRLESRFPPLAPEAVPRAEAIVALGGGIQPRSSRNPFSDLGAAADRYWHAARLWRAERAPVIVLSGGAQPWTDSEETEAEAAAQLLAHLGVPRERIILESQSLDTAGNARHTETLLRERGIRRILLVTSALHMRRALGRFAFPGIEVVPVATDHEVRDDPPALIRWLPSASALDGSRRALKEMLGYWVQVRRA